MIQKRREVTAALLGIVIAMILWVTILSREIQAGGVLFYKPFHSLGHLLRDIQRGGIRSNFLGNILLFIPVGLLLPLMTGWRKRTIVVGTGLSLFIEITQLLTGRGVFDPDDIILNCLGCVIGYGLLKVIERPFTKTDLNDADVADKIALTNVVNDKDIKEN